MASSPTPLLRWAGSKRRLTATLLRYWSPTHTRYIEPFAGSAALFFAVQPREAVLGDLNAEVIHLLSEVKSNPTGVARALTSLPRTKKTFLKLRASDPDSMKDPGRAARLLFLNHNCFNGLYRTNRSGQFNVPYSRARRAAMPSCATIRAASKALANTSLVHGDFEQVVRSHATAGSFVYLDPPFFVTSRRVFREYGPGAFGTDDLSRLRRLMLWMNEHSVHFLVSYADSPESRLLAKGFHAKIVTTVRNIGGFVDARRSARELMVSNFVPLANEID